MMTIHSAKGLEFPVVIIPGFEDGIFPGMQTIVGSDEDEEEERRLAYVALTRAKKRIYILHTKNRMLYGQTQYNPISRFVTEIPDEFITKEEEDADTIFAQNVYSRNKSYVFDSPYMFGAPQNKRSSSASPSNPDFRKPNFSSQPQTAKSTTQPIFKQQNSSLEVLAPGDRVRHMTFGDGEILSSRPMGADILYEVMFDNVGTKKVMATYAKLKKI
jgi:DNA helicase-2/ATP-dependent DNA helicase PcrA